MDKNNPIHWIMGGAGAAVIGFLLIDDYAPRFDMAANVMTDNLGVIPYRYVLIATVGGILYGVYLLTRQRNKPE
jgi:hypothetical protein